jgi:hypothetical protein
LAESFTVQASWDAGAGVWIATSADVPGLCCEAARFDEPVEIVLALVPELLADNEVPLPAGVGEIAVRVVAERHASVARVA